MKQKIDVLKIFETGPECYLVLAPDIPKFTILAVTDAYLKATKTQRSEIIGKSVFEVFPDNPDDTTKSVANATTSFKRVVENHCIDEMGIRKHDIIVPESEGGKFEERFWNAVNYPILGENGEVEYILHKVEDVTDSIKLKKDDKEHSINISLLKEIAQRDRVEEELRENEKKFRRLYESGLFGVIYWNMDNEIIDSNDKFLEMIGYTRDDLESGKINWAELTPPEYRKRDEDSVIELKKNGVNKVPFEKEYIRKDGTHIPILIAGAMLDEERFNGVALVLDITERKQFEEALRESEERYRGILDNIQDAYIRADIDGKIIMASPSAASMYRFDSPQEMLGIAISSLYKNIEDREHVLDLLKKLGKIKDNEIEGLRHDGTVFWASQNAQFHYDEHGQIQGTETTIRDITPQKIAEKDKQKHLENEQLLVEELQTSNEELQATTEELQQHMNKMVNLNLALKESEKKYYSLYSSMNEGVAIHEIIYNSDKKAVDYIFIDINESYENITGFKKDILGKKASEIYDTGSPPYLEIYAIVAETGHSKQFETYFEFLNKYISIYVISPEKGKFYTIFDDITEDKNAEKELTQYREHLEQLVEDRTSELEIAYKSLKDSREHYLTLFNSIDEGFCTIEVIFDEDNKPVDYRFLEFNPAFQEQTGLTGAKGKLMRELAPEHEEYWFEIYGKIAQTGKPMRFVNQAKALDRWYDVYAFKIGGLDSCEVAILFNDITKFKKTEKALKLSSIYNRSLIEASLDPLVTIGPNGKITDLNSSTEVATGYTKDELIGTDFSDYFTEPEKARDGYKQVFKEGSVHDYSLEIKHKNGGVTPVLYNASVYRDESDRVIGVFAAARDITEIRKYERELKEYQDTLEEKVKKRTVELAKSNSDLEHFAYVASHDLREPLRMITSFLQLLERRYQDQLDQDAHEFIGFAVDGAKRLNDMINDLLEYSKLTSKEHMLFETVNLENVLEKTLINLIIQTEENDADITYDPLPTVTGDEKLLTQLFQNLIGNAIKYRAQDPPKIHISSTKWNHKYILSVKDNGIGIEQHHLKRIFTIFQRLHGKDEYEGTGIGLAIAEKIVHHHGGEIWAESENGNGTTFYFTIPET